MSEFCNRLYIDSRGRTAYSASPTDFSIDLVEGLSCQSDTVCHVRACSFPNSWWTVAPQRDRLALRLELPDRDLRICIFIQLQHGYFDGFSFAEMMEAELNKATEAFILPELPQWTVLFIASETRVVAQFGDELLPHRRWQFLSEQELIAAKQAGTWTGPDFNPSTLDLVDDVLRMGQSSGGINVGPEKWVSGHYDAQVIHDLYIHSDLGRPLTNGPRLGIDKDVIARIPVTSPHNDVCHYESFAHQYDFIPVYFASNKILRFTITDYKGRVVDLAGGGDVVLELLFYNHPKYM